MHAIDQASDTVTTREVMHAFSVCNTTVPAMLSPIRRGRGRYQPALYSRRALLARLRELNGRDIEWPSERLLRHHEAAALIRFASGLPMATATLTNYRCTGKDAPPSIKISAGGTVRYERASVLAWIERRAARRTQHTPRRQRNATFVRTLSYL